MGVLDALKSITVEPILLLYMITGYMYNGASQDLIYTKVCLLHYQDADICSDVHKDSKVLDYVQTASSHWIKNCQIAITVPSIFTGYYLGAWSDRYGRKNPLIIPIVGAALCNLFFIFAGGIPDAPLFLVILGNLVQGLCGGFATIITSVMCYMADITNSKVRTPRIAILESMTFVGGIIGYFVGGAILPIVGHAMLFLIMLAIDTVIVIYIVMRIKDITPSNNVGVNSSGQDFSAMSVFSVWHVKDALFTIVKRRPGRRRLYLCLLLICAVAVLLASACEQDLTYLFSRDDPLRWNYSNFSYFSGAKMGIGALVLLLVVPLVRRWFQPHDTLIVLAGITSKAAGLILLGLSTTTFMMIFVPVVGCLSSVCMAITRAMLSKNVESEEQGKLFSVVSSIESACTLLGALIFNNLYPATRKFAHGFPFWLSAGLLLVPFTIFLWLRMTMKSNVETESSEGPLCEESVPFDDLVMSGFQDYTVRLGR